MNVILEIVFIVAVVASLFSNFYGLPGNILILISSFVYGIVPVLGAIIGSIIGVFAGATILEFFKSYNLREALLSGVGAFLGKIGGLSIKMCGAVTIIIMIGYKVL
jgi:uncharacterized protein YqgC (DUF456 family)